MAGVDAAVLNNKCWQDRNSLDVKDELSRPPANGARVKVCYAGVEYLEIQYANEPNQISSISGRPVFAIAGTVDELGDSTQQRLRSGDKVVVFVRKEIPVTLSEYVLVKDVADLVLVPDSLSMEMAAILPSGALRAYSALVRAKALAEVRIKPTSNLTNVLIVGPGNLSFWALKFFNFLVSDRSKFRVVIGDTNLHQLSISRDQGCQTVLNWNDSLHQDYILSRTKQAFLNQGIDVAIDFISSVETVSYIMSLLKEDGAILVSNNSLKQMTFNLTQLSDNNLNVVGMNDGTIDQLDTLLNLFSSAKVTPIPSNIYPADEEAKVVELLKHGRITGIPVLQFSCVVASTDTEARSSFSGLFI